MSDDQDRRRVSPGSEAAAIVAVMVVSLVSAFVISDWNASRGLFRYHNSDEHQRPPQGQYCEPFISSAPEQESAARHQGRTNGDKQKRYDLCQQWRMAEAAQAEAANSEAQFWVAIGNLLLLSIATIAAVGAALYARDAADAGNKTVTAANEANQILRDEQRPWMVFSEGPSVSLYNGTAPDGSEAKQAIAIHAVCMNVGAKPAHDSIMLTWHKVVRINDPDPQFDPEQDKGDRAPNGIVIAPSVVMSTSKRRLNNAETEGLANGKLKVLFYSKITYRLTPEASETSETECGISIIIDGTKTAPDGTESWNIQRSVVGHQNRMT